MRKSIYILASVAVILSACQKQEGTLPGNDSSPYAVLGTFIPELPYDSDCDVTVRFSANSATTELFYFVEKTAEKEARKLSNDAYAQYVIDNGVKVTTSVSAFDGAQIADVTLVSLYGDNTISAVAVSANKKYLTSTTFFGQQWNTVATGTYYLSAPAAFSGIMGVNVVEDVELQQNEDDEKLFRFKNLFDAGKHLNIVLLPDYQGEDEDGTYTFFRIPAQSTAHTYASYGDVSIRDIGYWQGDDEFVLSYGYESGMYEDYSCFIFAQLYVSAGNLGYGYSYFIPE